MASSFLQKKAEKRAEKIDREWGPDAYGGSNWRKARTGTTGLLLGREEAGAADPGSSFLQRKAALQQAEKAEEAAKRGSLAAMGRMGEWRAEQQAPTGDAHNKRGAGESGGLILSGGVPKEESGLQMSLENVAERAQYGGVDRESRDSLLRQNWQLRQLREDSSVAAAEAQIARDEVRRLSGQLQQNPSLAGNGNFTTRLAISSGKERAAAEKAAALKQQEKTAEQRIWSRLQEARYGELEATPGYAAYSAPAEANEGREDLWKAMNPQAGDVNLRNRKYRAVTEEERALYNYLYNTRGAEAAKRYVEDVLGPELDRREYEADQAEIADMTKKFGAGAALSVASVPLKVLGGTVGAADLALQNLRKDISGSTRPIDYYSPGMQVGTAGSDIRGAVSAAIEEGTENETLGKVGSFLYQTGMSIADSWLTAGLARVGVPAATTLLGGSAATDEARAAKERGASDRQALASGLAAGAAEMIFEKISIDRLLEPVDAVNFRGVLLNALQQGGVEASEEVATTLANALTDGWINGGRSEFARSRAQYLARGETNARAEALAWRDFAVELGASALGGFLSGGVSGGARGGMDLLRGRGAAEAQAPGAVEEDAQEAAERPQQDAEQRQGLTLPAREREAQPSAPVQDVGRESTETAEQRRGRIIRESGRTAGAAAEQIETAERLASALGRDVIFFRAPATAAGVMNGYARGGVIYINAASGNPVAQIFAHELTHGVERTHGGELTEAYAALRQLVLDRIRSSGGDLDAQRRRIRELYALNGVELDGPDAVDREIVAEYAEKNLLTDEASVLELVRQDRSLGQRIRGWIDSLLAKLGSNAARERDFLRRARDLYSRALEQTSAAGSREAGGLVLGTVADPEAGVRAEENRQGLTLPERERAGEAAQEREAPYSGLVLGGESSQASESEQGSRAARAEALRELREAYRRGDLSEAEFDDALDVILEGESLEDVGLLEQYSFGGVNANNANLETLRQAQEMERQGVAAETIFRGTGWYTGADGKWRFEMDDSQMEYHRGGDAAFARNHPEYARYQELQRQFIEGTIAEQDMEELRQLNEIWGREFGRLSERVARGNARLEDILVHDELFQNYPQLRRTGIRFADLEPGVRGEYRPETNEITLDNSVRNAPKDTLIHEIQHAIQRAEGFATGSSTEYWRKRLENGFDNRTHAELAHAESLQRQYDVMETQDPEFMREAEELYATVPDMPRGKVDWDTMEQIEEDPVEWREFDAKRDALEEKYGEKIYDFFMLKDDLNRARIGKREATDLYYNTAGEIEARDAAKRRTMTAEQRRATAPDIGDEDVVFAGDAGRPVKEQFSISETAEQGAEAAEEPSPADIVSSLPRKAQNYLERAERQLVARLGGALSVPKFAQRGFLQPIVREISAEVLGSGTVSRENLDRLFGTAWEQGLEADTEFYDTFKPVKDHLRTLRLEVSPEVAADITDYNDWRKRTFGVLRIVKEGGVPPDVAYGELQDMAPALFPAYITHPADQLQRMYEVGRSIRQVERKLDEAHSHDAEEFRLWAKNDFVSAIGDMLGELRTVKRYADDRREKEPTLLTTQAEVTDAYGKLKDARRAYEKVQAKHLLTRHDTVQLGRLLRGEIEAEHLDPARDNVRGILAVYEAKKEYDRLAKVIREWNSRRKEDLRNEADRYLETANEWKDKKAGILYSRETMERNVRDIVPDAELAERVIDRYFRPVHKAAAEAARLKEQYRERVRALDLSRKVKAGDEISEAAAVQLLGEATANIMLMERSRGRVKWRDGLTLEQWRDVERNVLRNNPGLDEGKLRRAVEEFRKIYDELFTAMNEARVRNGYEPINYLKGYFPHFSENRPDGILASFGKVLGIETEVSALPTSINGLTHMFRPGIQWFGHALERKGGPTAYDALEGFDRYIEGAADVIYQTDNIQRLRALASQVRYRTGDDGLREQVDAVQERTDLSDADKLLRIEEIYENGRYTLSNFVVELEEYTNLLANKKSRADRNMEQALGRDMYNLIKALESRVAANMVAVNPASWLTNLVPLTQGNALLDRGRLLRGMWNTLKAYRDDDGLEDLSSFLTNRKDSVPLVRTWAQEASAKLSAPMGYIDQFVAGSLVRARYAQNMERGMSGESAMQEADDWVAGVMADRSKGATPTLFSRRNPVTKVFTQFQLEVNNQLSYLFKDMPREKKKEGLAALLTALLKFALGAWFYNEIYEYFIGRRPALDPIGILNDTVGDFAGYELPNLVEAGLALASGEGVDFRTRKLKGGEAAWGLAENVLEEMPFTGVLALSGMDIDAGRLPVSSALPDLKTLADAAGNKDWSARKRLKEAGDELAKPLSYLVLPFGGGQLKKVFQTIRAVARGGSYSVDSEGNDILQYPVYNDTPGLVIGNALWGSLMGKSSLRTGQEWIESGFDSFSAKETATYQGMQEMGVPGKEAYAAIREISATKGAQEKRDALRALDISDVGKSVLFYGQLASDEDRALMDALTDAGEDQGRGLELVMGLKEARKDLDKLQEIAQAGLSPAGEETALRRVLSEKALARVQTAAVYDVDLDLYAKAADSVAKNNPSGGVTQEEARKGIDAIKGLSNAQRAALWQLQGDWAAKNNPYDVRVGQAVSDALENPGRSSGLVLGG